MSSLKHMIIGDINCPTKDRELEELTELLRKATRGAKDMISACEGEYVSSELMRTIAAADMLLHELEQSKAIQED